MKIKIAHVVVTPVMAGAQRICFEILSGLPDETYDKYLICGLDDYVENDTFFNRFESIGVKIITVPTLKRNIGKHDLDCFFRLFKVFRQHCFDIVHTHSTKAGVVARISAKLANTKRVIHTVHGVAFHRDERFISRVIFYLIEVFSTLFSDDLVTVNNYYRKYYKILPFVRLKTIYNGVQLSEREKNQKKCRDRNDVTILFLARLDRQKNPLFLIKAIQNIRDASLSSFEFRVRIVGDGPLRADCLDYVNRFDLQDIIEIQGWTDNVNLEFSNSDILCVPSNYEAFGLVFIESACFEIPTVSTFVEGIPEVVLHRRTGLLCQPNDIVGLSNALIELINNEGFRKELGKNAKAHSLNFSLESMVDNYISLYGDYK